MELRPSIPRLLVRVSNEYCQRSYRPLFRQQCRLSSSFRRTQGALRVQPDSSFSVHGNETSDHIIFNPPSSAPNVYHTPSKFMPKDDPRRRLYEMTSQRKLSSATATSASSPTEQQTFSSLLPPSLRPQMTKRYHLTQSNVEEIRRLRKEDPTTWTRVKLADKFNCSQFFVSLCVSSPEAKERQMAHIEKVKTTWGRRKTEAREERQRRKELWGRAE